MPPSRCGSVGDDPPLGASEDLQIPHPAWTREDARLASSRESESKNRGTSEDVGPRIRDAHHECLHHLAE